MAIDGLIILDNLGRPIIQSGFRSSSAAYPLLHIDAFNTALAKSQRAEDVDPILIVPPINAGEGPSACCHVLHEGIRFLCPISGDVDPLFAFAFLQTFVDILLEYFGTFSLETLKENFDVVYQLLEETLDSGGYPLTTSPNMLRDIVIPPSLLTKLLSVAGANLNTSPGASGPFSSPIPWRKAGLRYNKNEIYFDIVEDLKAVVDKNGTAVSSHVWGKMEANSKLSGTPDILLSFTNPHVMTDCAFHPCVRLPRWTRDKSLSFIPPDGHFTLLDYRFSPTSTATSTAPLAIPNTQPSPAPFTASSLAVTKDTVPVPLTLRSTVKIEHSTVTLDFTLTTRLQSRLIEDLIIEMYLGATATAPKFLVARSGAHLPPTSSSSGIGSSSTTTESLTGSSWIFDPKRRVRPTTPHPPLTCPHNSNNSTLGPQMGNTQSPTVQQLDPERKLHLHRFPPSRARSTNIIRHPFIHLLIPQDRSTQNHRRGIQTVQRSTWPRHRTYRVEMVKKSYWYASSACLYSTAQSQSVHAISSRRITSRQRHYVQSVS